MRRAGRAGDRRGRVVEVERPAGRVAMSLVQELERRTDGVFRWTGEGDPERDATGAGWRFVVLDSSDAADRDSFFSVCADAFDLPVAAVRSWDTLDLCLRGLDLGEPDGLLVMWQGWQQLADTDPDAFDCALEVFRDACVAWEDDDLPGAVLLVGDGPDTDLPEL
jgi:hypothetical protein